MWPWLNGLVGTPDEQAETGGERIDSSLHVWHPGRLFAVALALIASIPISLLPKPWRERIDPGRQLPLASGTIFSATIGLLGGLLLFGHAYLTGTGVLLEYLPPPIFLLLLVANTLDHSLRLLNGVTLSTPLGTFPLWAVERLVVLGQHGLTTLRTQRVGGQLPRAQLLRERPRPAPSLTDET